MTTEKKRRIHDVDAWRQLALVRIALKNKATSKADIAVLTEIIQRYHGQYGNGWASLDMLMSETGLHKTSVQRSIRRLVELTFVDIVAPGRRGRATVYVPNFALVPERGGATATLTTQNSGGRADSLGSAHATLSAGLGSADATLSPHLGSAHATPSSLHVPADKAGVRDGEDIDLCGATPPPAPLALGGGAAVPPKDRFDELFDAYGWRQKRAEARDAFKALPGDIDFDALLASAAEWREAWSEDGNAETGRRSLGQWLKREDYMCSPSRRRLERGTGARASKKANQPAANDNRQSAKPCVAEQAKVHSTSVEAHPDTGDSYLHIRFITQAHGTHDVRIAIEHRDRDFMEHEQARLRQLVRAAGLKQIDDSSELHGREILLTAKRGHAAMFQGLGLAA